MLDLFCKYFGVTPSMWFDLYLSQVRTLFVSGLPMDAKARDMYLLFRCYKVSMYVLGYPPLWMYVSISSWADHPKHCVLWPNYLCQFYTVTQEYWGNPPKTKSWGEHRSSCMVLLSSHISFSGWEMQPLNTRIDQIPITTSLFCMINIRKVTTCSIVVVLSFYFYRGTIVFTFYLLPPICPLFSVSNACKLKSNPHHLPHTRRAPSTQHSSTKYCTTAAASV